jgi:NAD(P)-dependent dehydrogenase (short-subunit alcohol dehydrogenase family)
MKFSNYHNMQSAEETATTLEGSKVVIVGGSSGIGFGAAEAIVERGADVILVGRSLDKLRVNVVSPGWVDTPMWDEIAGRSTATGTPCGKRAGNYKLAAGSSISTA